MCALSGSHHENILKEVKEGTHGSWEAEDDLDDGLFVCGDGVAVRRRRTIRALSLHDVCRLNSCEVKFGLCVGHFNIRCHFVKRGGGKGDG